VSGCLGEAYERRAENLDWKIVDWLEHGGTSMLHE
jgi:hypothetical protein